MQPGLCSNDLFENGIEGAGDAPVRVVRAELGQVGDVADVIAFAGFIYVTIVEFPPGPAFDTINGLEHGNAVFAAAAHIVDLAGAGISCKLLHRPHDIVTVNIVANLFALVAKNGIGWPARVAFTR